MKMSMYASILFVIIFPMWVDIKFFRLTIKSEKECGLIL
jgi:hypothetical protein